jgi:uncharacterized ferritin-like protein (DUF455 family)
MKTTSTYLNVVLAVLFAHISFNAATLYLSSSWDFHIALLYTALLHLVILLASYVSS